MTVTREVWLLPAIFLTVTLLGGLRIGPSVRLIPPPLIALVLGLLLIAALVRARVVVPVGFVHARRTRLENASGIVVLITLAAASAQVFTLLIPDRGLWHVMFGTFFFVHLLTTIAGTSERRLLLRSLLVLLGAAFVLRFVVLESLYGASGGTLTRLLTVLMEGMSLGALHYEANAAATGYLALLALALYLTALYLLDPDGGRSGALVVRRDVRPGYPAERHELDRDLATLRRE